MNQLTKVEKEVLATYKDFMNTYFIKHDLEKSLSFLAPNAILIGTGKDEIIKGKKEAEEAFLRDFTQAPNPIYIDYYFIEPQILFDNSCIIFSSYKLNTYIDDLPLELNPLRSTIIFKKIDNNWKIVHSHISLPFSLQKDGESFPLEALRERNRLLQHIIGEKNQEIGKLMRELEKLATIDKLTNIYNRSKFEDFLIYEIERANRYNTPFSLLMFDIDNFKEINDTLGHIVGDDVLCSLAAFTKKLIRKTDIFARWGGDEFIILLPNTKLKEAKECGEKIKREIKSHDFDTGNPLTISIGITEYKNNEDVVSLIKRVDRLLYAAKKSGKDTIITG